MAKLVLVRDHNDNMNYYYLTAESRFIGSFTVQERASKRHFSSEIKINHINRIF